MGLDGAGVGLGLGGAGAWALGAGALGAGALGAGAVGAGAVGAGIRAGAAGLAGAAVGMKGGGELARAGAAACRRGLARSFIAGSVPTGATLTIPTAVAEEPAAGLAGALRATAGVPWPLSRSATPAARTRITDRSATRARRLANRGSRRQPVDGTASRLRCEIEPDLKVRFPLNLFWCRPRRLCTEARTSYRALRAF